MRILIAVDRSEYSEIVLEHGFDQAVRRAADELHFLTAVERNADVDAARIWLGEAVTDLVDTFGCSDRKITMHVRVGQPAPAIAALARELRPDLLVIGRFSVPSASDLLLEIVDSPTLVVGPEGHVLEPQCPDCERVRRDSDGERLFCDKHEDDYLPMLWVRVPPAYELGSRLW